MVLVLYCVRMSSYHSQNDIQKLVVEIRLVWVIKVDCCLISLTVFLGVHSANFEYKLNAFHQQNTSIQICCQLVWFISGVRKTHFLLQVSERNRSHSKCMLNKILFFNDFFFYLFQRIAVRRKEGKTDLPDLPPDS